MADSCGDGTLDPGEICDDGDLDSDDGCDDTCELVSTASCPVWMQDYDLGLGPSEDTQAVTVDSEGRIIIVGRVDESRFTLSLSSAGDPLWQSSGEGVNFDVTTAPGDDVLVSGYVGGTHLERFSVAGDPIWTAPSTDGNITGLTLLDGVLYSAGAALEETCNVRRHDLTDGSVSWTASDPSARCRRISHASAELIAAGTRETGEPPHGRSHIHVDTNGVLLEAIAEAGGEWRDVAGAADGGLFLAGVVDIELGDWLVVRLGTEGEVVWTDLLEGERFPGESERAEAIAPLADGGALVVGTRLRRYGASGELRLDADVSGRDVAVAGACAVVVADGAVVRTIALVD